MRNRFTPSRVLCVAAALLGIGGVLVPGGGANAAVSPRTPAAGTTCAGPLLVKATGDPWVCSFDDEFNGTALNRSRWVVQKTSDGAFQLGSACMVDTPQTVSVANGQLSLTVRRASAPFRCYKSRGYVMSSWNGGSVYTNSFSQKYGRWSIRAKFPDGEGIPGLQSAIWTYPIERRTALGAAKEIDIAEAYSRWPDMVLPTVHTSLGGKNGNCDMPHFGGGWHTYTLEWTPAGIASFYYDGVMCFWAGHAGATNPFRLLLTQGLGIQNNTPTKATVSPATMQVDWVRIWK